MMKKVIAIFLLGAFVFSVFATHADAVSRVKGYYRKSGKYVAPHFKSTRNYNKFDNYSTKGNTNPITGKKGTVNPYKLKY